MNLKFDFFSTNDEKKIFDYITSLFDEPIFFKSRKKCDYIVERINKLIR